MTLLQDTLWVLTDRLHKFAFKQHVQILSHLFGLVENNTVRGGAACRGSAAQYLTPCDARRRSLPRCTRKM